MKKICPKCRNDQNDERLVACPICRVPFVNENEVLTNFTREELKTIATYILRDWRVYIVAGIILALGVALLYWPIRGQIRAQIIKFQTVTSNQVVTAYSNATNDLANQFETFTRGASNQIVFAYSAVTNEINAEFQTPRVKGTVENVAKSEAKEILQDDVQPTVEEFRTNLERKIESVENEQSILELDAKARANDYQAFLKLCELSKETNDIGTFAATEVSEIDRDLEIDRASYSYMALNYSFGGKTYSGPFTSDEVAMTLLGPNFHNTSTGEEGLANEIRNKKQPLFMSGMINLLNKTTDLMAANRITLAISDISKNDFHPEDLSKINAWWEANKLNYTNWPFEQLQLGLNKFSILDYSDAADSFENVLKIDPAADMSRALLVGCYWEIGDTNRAISAAKNFSDPSGRWAQWANVKTELEHGDITNGTIQFINLYTNRSIMFFDGFINEQSPFWRQVDWQTLHKQVSP